MSALPNALRATGWRPGFRLDVSTWLDASAPAGGPAFRTGRSEGELLVEGGPGARPALLRIPLSSARVVLVEHNGMAMGGAGQPPSLVLAVHKAGCLVINGLPSRPTLFSPDQEIRILGAAQVLDLGPVRIALACEPGDPSRAAACLSEADMESTAHQAIAMLETDAFLLFDEGREPRSLLNQLPADEETPAALTGFETMAGALRPARGGFSGRWCDTGDGVFDFTQLSVLMAAWTGWDATVARDLVLAAVDALEPDGRLPAWVNPSTRQSAASCAPPSLVFLAAQLLRAHPEPILAKELLPVLRQTLAWWLTHSDPHRRGVPVWPDGESSLVPALFQDRASSAGLASLLLQELIAFSEIAEACPDPERDDRWVQFERGRMIDMLEHHFWNGSDGMFADRLEDGSFIRGQSVSGWLAAGTPGIQPALRERALMDFEGQSSLLGPHGFHARSPKSGGDTPPPVPVTLQWFLVRALDVGDKSWRGPRTRAVVRRRLVQLVESSAVLPKDLHAIPTEPAWLPGAGALLLWLVSQKSGAVESRALSPGMRWLEMKRRSLGLALIGTGTLALLFAVVATTLRPDNSHANQVTRAGLAKNKYLLHDYAGAITLYDQLVTEYPTSEMAGDYHYLRGNCYFHMEDWSSAEANYREALRRRPDFVQPRWNLAQTLHRQGRTDEAIMILEETDKQLGSKGDLELKKRIGDALSVLKKHQARTPLEPRS